MAWLFKWFDETKSKLSGKASSESRASARKRQHISRSNGHSKSNAGKGPSRVSPYRSVSVQSTSGGCEAVLRIKDTRFLATIAPQLPLGGCDNAQQCSCRYKYHTDRRVGLRRDADHGLPAGSYHNVDRRHRRDRRATATH